MAVERIGNGKIVPIELLRQQRAEAAGGKKSAQEAGRGRETASPASGRTTDSDRTRLMAEVKSDLDELPDVRRDKVIEAKLRISSGYYDRAEIRKQILQSVLGSILGPGPSAVEPGKNGTDEGSSAPESQ